MRFKTRVCDMLEVEHPIFQAGMGSLPGHGTLAGPELVAAVSRAGGLGGFSVARVCRPTTPRPGLAHQSPDAEAIRNRHRPAGGPSPVGIIRTVRAQIDQAYWGFVEGMRKRYGIPPPKARTEPIYTRMTFEDIERQVQVILDHQVPVFATGLGADPGIVRRMHDRNIKVLALVGNTRTGRQVAEMGVDVIVATGTEGGGHGGLIGTLALVRSCSEAVGPLPLVAGGGIVDGKGLAAALALGAEGVWCGTLFLTAAESGIADWYRELILRGDEESTIQSKILSGKNNRHFAPAWEKDWAAASLKLLPFPLQGILAWDLLDSGIEGGMGGIGGGRAGQGIACSPRSERRADYPGHAQGSDRGRGSTAQSEDTLRINVSTTVSPGASRPAAHRVAQRHHGTPRCRRRESICLLAFAGQVLVHEGDGHAAFATPPPRA